ncbi:MAG: class II aldolase/adducin family protein [Devosia sp.]
MMSESDLRHALADSYRYLERHCLTEQASGNVSARLGAAMLISPGGATADTIHPDAFVRVALDGTVEGEGRPSSERLMHLAIYRACGEAGAIVHTHSDHCVGLSSCREGIPGFHYLVGSFGGSDIPCTDYAVFGSDALADQAANLLRTRFACLLANHGAIAWGKSVAEATMRAHRVEILARQYVIAKQAGTPVLLTEEEFADYREMVARFTYA